MFLVLASYRVTVILKVWTVPVPPSTAFHLPAKLLWLERRAPVLSFRAPSGGMGKVEPHNRDLLVTCRRAPRAGLFLLLKMKFCSTLAPVMLMMRLQRVGRKNDPSYRIVVTDKRTGPKSNKHIAILGSYNPKLDHVQVDKAAATEWLSKGVQPSDTVHNILVAQKVIEGKKINVLPKKSPIVDEEALAKEAEEKAAAEAKAKEEAEAPAEEPAQESEDSQEDKSTEETVEEAPTEEVEAPEAEAEESVSEATEKKE